MPDAVADWAVEIDRDVCMGSGQCVHYAPQTFAHDDEAKSVLLESPGDPFETVRTAVEACPTGALTLFQREREG